MNNAFVPDYIGREFGDYQTRVVKYALHYADREWPVVPLYSIYSKTGACSCRRGADCASPAKHPIPINGVKAATVKVDVIEQWWKQHRNANIGIATGHGLLVIDIDPRHGGSLETLVERFALPDTALVRTGSGGWHLYFAHSGLLKNSAGKLGEGIDVRGIGGYVVAPPSLHASGNYYAWANQLNPVPLPENLLAALTALETTKRPAPAVEPQVPFSLLVPPREAKQTPLIDATKLLELARENPIPEGKRNGVLLSMGGALRNQGATVKAIYEALQIINTVQCEPPLSEKEVRAIATAAMKWEQGKFSQEQLILPQMFTLDVLLRTVLPEPQWAIPGFLPQGVTLLGGKPKMGKSWLALAISLAIAEGLTALGKLRVTRGDVLYLGLEDSMRRMSDRANKLLQGRTPPANFTWVGQWNMLNDNGLADLEDWIAAHPDTRLVVIDTLAKVRPSAGVNGNGYSDDYGIMTPLKRISEEYNMAILVIHHLRKMGAADVMDTFSGTTGLTGATDCNMVLDRERGKDTATLHITGRDIEEQELLLRFESETAQWTLQSTDNAPRLSKEQRELLHILDHAAAPMSPLEISNKLGINPSYGRKLVHDMVKADHLRQVKRGLYEMVRDVTEGNEADEI